jgi:hypothetical protein
VTFGDSKWAQNARREEALDGYDLVDQLTEEQMDPWKLRKRVSFREHDIDELDDVKTQFGDILSSIVTLVQDSESNCPLDAALAVIRKSVSQIVNVLPTNATERGEMMTAPAYTSNSKMQMVKALVADACESVFDTVDVISWLAGGGDETTAINAFTHTQTNPGHPLDPHEGLCRVRWMHLCMSHQCTGTTRPDSFQGGREKWRAAVLYGVQHFLSRFPLICDELGFIDKETRAAINATSLKLWSVAWNDGDIASKQYDRLYSAYLKTGISVILKRLQICFLHPRKAVRAKATEHAQKFRFISVPSVSGKALEAGARIPLIGPKSVLAAVLSLPGFHKHLIEDNDCIKVCCDTLIVGGWYGLTIPQLVSSLDRMLRDGVEGDGPSAFVLDDCSVRDVLDPATGKTSITVVVIVCVSEAVCTTVLEQLHDFTAAALRSQSSRSQSQSSSSISTNDWWACVVSRVMMRHGGDGGQVQKSQGFTIAGLTIDHNWLTNHPVMFLPTNIYPGDDHRADWGHFLADTGAELQRLGQCVLHVSRRFILVDVLPAGDGAWLRAQSGVTGPGSTHPHTDSRISKHSAGNIFLAYLHREHRSKLNEEGTAFAALGGWLGGAIARTMRACFSLHRRARDELDHADLFEMWASDGSDIAQLRTLTPARRTRVCKRVRTTLNAEARKADDTVGRGRLKDHRAWLAASIDGGECEGKTYSKLRAGRSAAEISFLMDAQTNWCGINRGRKDGENTVYVLSGCEALIAEAHHTIDQCIFAWNEALSRESVTNTAVAREPEFTVRWQHGTKERRVDVGTLIATLKSLLETIDANEHDDYVTICTSIRDQLKPLCSEVGLKSFVHLLGGVDDVAFYVNYGMPGPLHTKFRCSEHTQRHTGMRYLLDFGSEDVAIKAYARGGVTMVYGSHPHAKGCSTFKAVIKAGHNHGKIADIAPLIGEPYARRGETEMAFWTESNNSLAQFIYMAVSDKRRIIAGQTVVDAGYAARLGLNTVIGRRVNAVPSVGQHLVNLPQQYRDGKPTYIALEQVIEAMIAVIKSMFKHIYQGAVNKSLAALERRWNRIASVGASQEEMQELVDSLQQLHDCEDVRARRNKFNARQTWLIVRIKAAYRHRLEENVRAAYHRIWGDDCASASLEDKRNRAAELLWYLGGGELNESVRFWPELTEAYDDAAARLDSDAMIDEQTGGAVLTAISSERRDVDTLLSTLGNDYPLPAVTHHDPETNAVVEERPAKTYKVDLRALFDVKSMPQCLAEAQGTSSVRSIDVEYYVRGEDDDEAPGDELETDAVDSRCALQAAMLRERRFRQEELENECRLLGPTERMVVHHVAGLSSLIGQPLCYGNDSPPDGAIEWTPSQTQDDVGAILYVWDSSGFAIADAWLRCEIVSVSERRIINAKYALVWCDPRLPARTQMEWEPVDSDLIANETFVCIRAPVPARDEDGTTGVFFDMADHLQPDRTANGMAALTVVFYCVDSVPHVAWLDPVPAEAADAYTMRELLVVTTGRTARYHDDDVFSTRKLYQDPRDERVARVTVPANSIFFSCALNERSQPEDTYHCSTLHLSEAAEQLSQFHSE